MRRGSPTVRDWTRTAPPRGRLDELADLLAAWCPDGQTLRRLRLAAGWPLERVAEECGVHKARASRVSAWESGARKIPAGRRLQVLAACDLMASEAGEPLRIRKERILALVGNNGGRAPLKEVHHQFRRIVNRRYLDDPLTNEAIATLLHEKALHLVETADPDGAPTARSKPWLYVLDPKSPRLTGVQAGNRRDAAGVTLRAFARTVGCTEPTLRRLERSESRLPLHRAVVFEAVLRDFERRGTVAERVARDVLAVVAARPGIPRYAVSYAVRDQIGNVRGVQGTFGYSGHLLPTVDAMVHDGRLVYGNAWDLRGCLYQGLYLPAEVHRAPRDTAVFAGRLRELRRAAELTCAELAAMVDVSPNAVSRWETGVRSLSPARMVQLQAALGARRTRA
jgi:transcriptional regulator with XRE-family HTH domain